MVDQLQFRSADTTDASSSEGGVRRAPRVLAAVVIAGLIAGAAGLAAGWWLGGDGTADDPPAEMTATIDAWIAATVEQDPGAAAALYADDATWYDEALDDRATGRDGIRRAWAIYSDVEESGSELIAANADTAVLRWWLIGYFDWALEGISVLEFDGGEIVAETVYYDCAQSPLWRSCANM